MHSESSHQTSTREWGQMASILIVDDDIELCMMLRDYFALQDLELSICHNGREGLQAALHGGFDLVILDVMLPELDGFQILRQLRSSSQISIVLLTSRNEDEEVIFGLENGADDYVPKPFNPRELLARIRSILRRRSFKALTEANPADAKTIERQGFVLIPASQSVHYRGIPLSLSPVEFLLLEALLQGLGTILPREELTERVLHRAYHPLDRGLDMLVSRLRRKLEIADNPGALIKTIRSAGYVLSARV
jgi:DNA-binding response OmpR family regulator